MGTTDPDFTSDAWEPPDIVGWPAAVAFWAGRVDSGAYELGPGHDELRAELTAELERQVAAVQG